VPIVLQQQKVERFQIGITRFILIQKQEKLVLLKN